MTADAATSPMIAVETHAGRARLEALRERWDRLWSLTPDPTFSRTFAWFRAAADESDAVPRVFSAAVDGKVIGLWPMFGRETGSVFGRRIHLRCAGRDGPSSGIVGPAPAATAAILARHLARRREWRSFTYSEPAGSSGVAAASDAFIAAGLATRTISESLVGEVELGGRLSDLLDACDERIRLAVYRTHHYAADDGYRLSRDRPPAGAARPHAIDEALEIARHLDRHERAVVAATMTEAAHRGAADVAVLRFYGHPVAAALSHVGSTGLENRLAVVAPDAPPLAGVRLLLDLFRDGQRRGDRRFTFASTPSHPAAGWTRRFVRRRTVRVEPAGRSGTAIRRIGRGLRTACGFSLAAEARTGV